MSIFSRAKALLQPTDDEKKGPKEKRQAIIIETEEPIDLFPNNNEDNDSTSERTPSDSASEA